METTCSVLMTWLTPFSSNSAIFFGFKPFAIHLSDGRRFVIPQRDFIAFTPKKIALFDEKGVSHVINTLHVASIDDSVEQGA